MALLASDLRSVPLLKAADLTSEKKLRIKSVTEELIGSVPTRREAHRLVHQR